MMVSVSIQRARRTASETIIACLRVTPGSVRLQRFMIGRPPAVVGPAGEPLERDREVTRVDFTAIAHRDRADAPRQEGFNRYRKRVVDEFPGSAAVRDYPASKFDWSSRSDAGH